MPEKSLKPLKEKIYGFPMEFTAVVLVPVENRRQAFFSKKVVAALVTPQTKLKRIFTREAST